MMQPVDAIGTLVRFARSLRDAGLAVSVEQIQSFARAFEWLDPRSLSDIQHAARATLVTRAEDLPAFDAAFAAFWLDPGRRARPRPAPRAPRHAAGAERPALARLLLERARQSDPPRDVPDRSGSASAVEVLSYKDFGRMTREELLLVRRSFLAERWRLVERKSRRRVPHRRGRELDWRRLTARAARAGGVVLVLPRRRPKVKQRPLVVLADVSGSMELYTRVVLYLLYALEQKLARVEAFVFATRLTRITPELKTRDIERALDGVSERVIDFQSGTRIGECLRQFNLSWSRRVLGRGAVVLVVSDGWDCGDTRVLEQQMQSLRARCHRLIWLNPRLGQPRYEPRVSGMAAALPYVDDFLAAHNLASLRGLAEHLGRLPRRRTKARRSSVRGVSAGGRA